MDAAKSKALKATVIILVLAATIPIFFEIFREAAFNTVPRDDYASYLLALVGQGGQVPGSPYAYRIFSVLAAIPFYFILPLYRFTNLEPADLSALQATEALAMVSYLAILLTAVVVYLTARKRFLASPLAASLAGLAALVLSYNISRPGIDPLAVLLIACLYYTYNRPGIFSALVLLSAGFNEKIPFVFVILSFSRWVWMRWFTRERGMQPVSIQLAASSAALVAYFAARWILPLPGFENQTNPSTFFTQLVASFGYLFSLKGLILNLIPIAILFTLAGLSALGSSSANRPYAKADLACAFALLGVALVIDLQFTIGRVVMYGYPLYLPAIAPLIDRLVAPQNSPGVVTNQEVTLQRPDDLPSL